MVVVDGFTSFTSTQGDMLKLLAEHAEMMLVTVPYESSQTRKELFAQPESALAILNGYSGSFETVQLQKKVQGNPDLPAGLLAVRTQLFENSRQLTPLNNAHGVSCFSALGPRAEIRETARRVNRGAGY